MSISVKDRFWKKVQIPQTDDGCWNWLGAKSPNGYGKGYDGNKVISAHRLAFILLRGPIPQGLQIDHLCRNRSCVNPEHMEAVSQRENLLRGIGTAAVNFKKTHCINGHEFTPENTKMDRGWRRCRACAKNASLNRKKDLVN